VIKHEENLTCRTNQNEISLPIFNAERSMKAQWGFLTRQPLITLVPMPDKEMGRWRDKQQELFTRRHFP